MLTYLCEVSVTKTERRLLERDFQELRSSITVRINPKNTPHLSFLRGVRWELVCDCLMDNTH